MPKRSIPKWGIFISIAIALGVIGLATNKLLPASISTLLGTLLGVGSALLYHRLYLTKLYDDIQKLDNQADDLTARLNLSNDKIIKTLIDRQQQNNQFFETLAGHVDHQAVRTADISQFIDILQKSITDQCERAQRISEIAAQMSGSVQIVAENVEQAGQAARETSSQSDLGTQAVTALVSDIGIVGQTVDQVADALASLQQQSLNIQSIAKVINGIAEQTNLLALNAAIEAARAGEYGRGFSVVADEVRGLANQTSKATSEIDTMLGKNREQAETVVHLMTRLNESTNQIVDKVKETGETLKHISERAHYSNLQVSTIVQTIQEHVQASENVFSAIDSVSQELDNSQKNVAKASADTMALTELAENVLSSLGFFTLGKRHDLVRKIALETARHIGQLFEKSIADGRITMEALFDRHYQPIANTNPTKFHTQFDQFTDQVLPAIQEPILQKHAFILFAGAVDTNGYFPTHNHRYAKPLTGNFETDLTNNRTKRIFNDRTGSRCGSHTQEFLLQTYKRDTGEVIHDLSAPIYVNQRHWGGFRIGYQANRQNV